MLKYTNFLAPHGDKTMLLRKLKDTARIVSRRELSVNWKQVLVSELIADKAESKKFFYRWISEISKCTGLKLVPDHYCFVLHYGAGDVLPHIDRVSSTCFLAPIVSSPTIMFLEKYRKLAFSDSKLIRFNDSNEHGVTNPHRATFVVMSISRDLH